MEFLKESSVAPANVLESKREKLELPSLQGADEYRIYHNERTEKREVQGEGDEVTEVDVTVYDYVSMLSDHEPTDDDWREVLTTEGYSKTSITNILKNK